MGPGLGHWRQQADQPVLIRGARYADHELCSQGTLIKKKTKFSSEEIQMRSGAKLYMRKGFLIYEEMRKFFPINEEAVSDTAVGKCRHSSIYGCFSSRCPNHG